MTEEHPAPDDSAGSRESKTDRGKVLEKLRSPDPEVREMGIHLAALAQLPEAVPLLTAIGENDPSPDLRYFARKTLDILERASTFSGIPIVPDDPVGLKNSLHHPDVNVRTLSIPKLVERLGHEALAPLLGIVGSERNPRVRSALVKGLGAAAGTSDPSIVELVVKMFLTDPDARVRANAVEALGLMQARQATASLIEMFMDENHRVRANAALVLSEWGAANVTGTAEQMIATGKPRMIHAASYILLHTMSDEGLALLRHVLESSEHPAKEKMIQALEDFASRGNVTARSLLAAHGTPR